MLPLGQIKRECLGQNPVEIESATAFFSFCHHYLEEFVILRFYCGLLEGQPRNSRHRTLSTLGRGCFFLLHRSRNLQKPFKNKPNGRGCHLRTQFGELQKPLKTGKNG